MFSVGIVADNGYLSLQKIVDNLGLHVAISVFVFLSAFIVLCCHLHFLMHSYVHVLVVMLQLKTIKSSAVLVMQLDLSS